VAIKNDEDSIMDLDIENLQPPVQIENINTAVSENTYTVSKGDSLWSIAVKAYGDGYKWTEIANANNLKNPNVIFTGTSLNLPR
jgi:nucleoid-associated protein YgaU